MSATIATLRAMRERLRFEERWTKYTSARNAAGQSVKPENPEAVCWCLQGAAIVEVGLNTSPFVQTEAVFYQALLTLGTRTFYWDWQDRHTHAEMLGLIDRAIELTEAAQ